ncbi:alpha/beta hydrolase family protein [Glycomyces xiaoerkulensis]|uniref:alpha/beta hydrolase family protein n=1 Tax=Glycomyces xiaoerkulensis TaxID=2038139 RepID=UPI000C25E330|nr:chlorophyllase [Glycomyces xiaoerkulensis]
MSTASLAPAPVQSVAPLTLTAPDRPVDLQVRVSAPVTGGDLPIILLSHGGGPSNHLSSLNGYAPLADHFAANGFVVIQPTHLDSKSLDLELDDPDAVYWRSRAQDMTRILDRLDQIEAAVPQLAGRIDRGKAAAVGHSAGGVTVNLLLGARLTEPDGTEVNLTEPRITAGVLLASIGRGEALSDGAARLHPRLATVDFSTMTAPTLVVAGDRDDNPRLTIGGPDWHADPYHLAPGPKTLVTLYGAEHGLGGVSGYDVAETTDENPERAAAVARLSRAYLRTELYPGDTAWQEAREALATGPDALGRIESK